MITREYKTKRECAELFVSESFSRFDSTYVTELPEWFESWEFMGWNDETEMLDYCDEPMWSTWFMFQDYCEERYAIEHPEEVAQAGFTLIYHDGDLVGLGIDGAGYDFYEHHWMPLYDLHGFEWHDED